MSALFPSPSSELERTIPARPGRCLKSKGQQSKQHADTDTDCHFPAWLARTDGTLVKLSMVTLRVASEQHHLAGLQAKAQGHIMAESLKVAGHQPYPGHPLHHVDAQAAGPDVQHRAHPF